MQEASFAPRIQSILGHHVIEWALVEAVLANLTGANYCNDAFHMPFSHGSYGTISDIFSSPQVINNQRKATQEMQNGGESKLLDVLARFRHTKSTDPRDKVFALLNLTLDTIGVQADYHKPTREVYIDVVRNFINSSANLDILCQSQWGVHENPNLPFWVPDFHCPGKSYFLFAQRNIFCAGDPRCNTPCQISIEGHISLAGINLGKVVGPQRGLPLENWDSLSSHRRQNMIQSLLQIRRWMPDEVAQGQDENGESTSSPKHTANESLFQSFWRTVSVDCKAYPMVRLSTSDIQHDIAILKKLPKLPFPATEQEMDQSLTKNLASLKIAKSFERVTKNMTFARSEFGQYAMVPLEAQEGDELVVLHGAKVPLVLRAIKSSLEDSEVLFTTIGGAYVHGFMDGEARMQVERGLLEEKTFTLV